MALNYRYEPLCTPEAIRLLVVDLATHDDEPLSCSIIHYRRPTKQIRYSAVSYAWGVPSFSRTLSIKCNQRTALLSITADVEALLRHIRSMDETQYLWIDAICLNQEDDLEKAQQIPLMGQIFAEAEHVHIWLGPETQETAAHINFLREASWLPKVRGRDMAEHVISLAKRIYQPAYEVAPEEDSLHSSLHAMDLILRCTDFFQRPWFSRRWIIQEAWLAKKATVHCGKRRIPLQMLVSAASQYQTIEGGSYRINMVASLRRPNPSTSLLELLWTFHEAECLEPRDRIFALLGLARNGGSYGLDYSLHWTELYKQVAEYVLATGDNDTRLQLLLHLFEFGPVSLPMNATYPSWVPDWSHSRRISTLPFHSQDGKDTSEEYPSSPGHSEKATISFTGGALQVKGRYPNRLVTSVKHRGQTHHSLEDQPGIVRGILTELLGPGCDSPQRKLVLDTLLNPIAGISGRGEDGNYSNSFGKNMRDIHGLLESEAVRPFRKIYSLLGTMSLFEMEPIGHQGPKQRRFGFGPRETRPGDEVVPLWRIAKKSESPRGLSYRDDAGIHLFSAIVVRRIPCRGFETQDTGSMDERPVLGRILGPAMCTEPINAVYPESSGLWDHTKNAYGKFLFGGQANIEDRPLISLI